MGALEKMLSQKNHKTHIFNDQNRKVAPNKKLTPA